MKETILVVEGEKRLRQRYQNALRSIGYDVITAPNGKRALNMLRSEPIDLIVADLELPDGSGFEYLEECMSVKRKVKVVINTDQAAYKTDFHSWVADAFLTKSSDLTELTSTIASVLHSIRPSA